ncbi:ubiquitin-protein ligase [Mycena olivaceomarginata]|nr:ubiquitin-protein ligase [Mycena olivaceomarginata]
MSLRVPRFDTTRISKGSFVEGQMAEGLRLSVRNEDELHGLMESKAETLQDEALLRYYAAEWDRTPTGANYLHRLFTYLDRYWVKRERDQGKKGVYQVSPSPSGANTSLHPSNPHSPPPSCASSPPSATAPPSIKPSSKKVVDSFVSLGLDVYKKQFEAPFLTATEAYYSEAEAFLNPGGAEGGSGNILEYLKEAEGRKREEEGCKAFACKDEEGADGEVHYSTSTRTRTCSACTPFSPASPGLEPLRRKFEVHVKAAGLGAVSALVAAPAVFADKGAADKEKDKGEGKAGELDPKAYVDALLAVHEKNAATVARSFKGEAGFAAALDKACRELVNRNAATGTSAARLLELLAKRADMLLRKSNKVAGDVDLEGALNWVMFYTTKLSKRLIHGVSASDEAEASMISKLKEACGFETTTTWVLRSASWCLGRTLGPRAADARLLLPPELLPTVERFTRVLSDEALRPQAHLAAQTTPRTSCGQTNEPEGHTMTPADQAAALLQYNGNDTLSLAELQEATNFSREILGQVLALLVKAKVLINEEKGSNRESGQDDENQALIQEVISQISQRFTPKIPDIKKAIETLLEKEN